MFATCASDPLATCKPNYCGKCDAVWFDAAGGVVECVADIIDIYIPVYVDAEEPSEPPLSIDECPQGVELVECEADPCLFTNCDKFPDAECRPSFCGECKATFFSAKTGLGVNCYLSPFVPFIFELPTILVPELPTFKIPEVECPEGILPTECEVDPCLEATCLKFPDATCKASICGECSANFFSAKTGFEVSCVIIPFVPYVPELPIMIIEELPTMIIEELPTMIIEELPTMKVEELPTMIIEELPTMKVEELPTMIIEELPTMKIEELPTKIPEVVSEIVPELGTEVAPEVVVSVPVVEPSMPAVEPSVPAVEPSVPAVEPSVPAVEPSVPAVEPSMPAVEPSVPAVEPSAAVPEEEGSTIKYHNMCPPHRPQATCDVHPCSEQK